VENLWFNVIYSVTPTILIGLVFWFIMRAILRADRGERSAYEQIEREERAKRGLPVTEEAAPDTGSLDQREENRLSNS
jgi:flagellar biosynthesis/type III secretory pathway M-ring protein FliF/YscJ